MTISAITLGTAQLGLEYGIANKTGKPDTSQALRILRHAWDNGINSFDTAPGYGNSEQIIGSFIESMPVIRDDIVITSKLPGIPQVESLSQENLTDTVRNHVKGTLASLCLETIPFYLAHRPKELLFSNERLLRSLIQMREEGLIREIGVSVYTPGEAERALTFKELTAIQVPVNVFDHRCIESGLLSRLAKQKFTVFARSVFLQGLFMLPLDVVPNYLEQAREPLSKLHAMARRYHVDIDALCFSFVRDLDAITSIVIGAETIEQVTRNCRLIKQPGLPIALNKEIYESFRALPEKLIDPSQWNKT